jgi:hypothetical protein
MLNNNLKNDEEQGNNYCSGSGTDFPLSSFASLANSQPSDDGAAVNLICSTNVWANVDPLEYQVASDYLRTLSSGYQVLWR